MLLEVLSNLERVLAVLLHPQGQCLNTHHDQPRVHGSEAAPKVAQPDGDAEVREGRGARRRGEVEAMVGRLRLSERLELALAPVELPAVDDDTSHGVAVPAHVLGERVDHNVGTVLDGPAQIGRGEGVVHQQGHLDGVGGVGEGLEVDDDAARVGEGLNEESLHVGLRERLLDSLDVLAVHEVARPAVLKDRAGELSDGATVQVLRGDDLVARVHEGVEGGELGRVPAGRAHPHDAPLEVGDLGAELHDRGVGQAGVDHSRFLQREQARSVGRVIEHKGGRRGDVGRAGARGRVRGAAGVERARLEPGERDRGEARVDGAAALGGNGGRHCVVWW
mmetsp:Transcript_60628/g.149087  ORF Transcript_60628/g.149087 Transcript_60628/m.149087 type:complete len:335 (+) Transcript_60628:659-1663(+)